MIGMVRHWQLPLAALWLAVAGFLLTNEPRWWPGIVGSLVFALWNVVRWWMQRPKTEAAPRPVSRRKPSTEYNPQFDFQQMEDRWSGG
jgi:hypothetical protein